MEERKLSFRPLPFVFPTQYVPAPPAQPSGGLGAYLGFLKENCLPSRKTEKKRRKPVSEIFRGDAGEALRALCFHDIIAELVQGLYDSGVKALLWSCDRTEEAAGLSAAPRSMIQGALLKVVRE